MTGSPGLLTVALQASLPAAVSLAALGIALVLGALISLDRVRACQLARREAERFEAHFWSGVDLVALLADASKRRPALSGPEAVFEAGFREYARLKQKPGLAPALQRQGAQRAMRATARTEITGLRDNLGNLERIARAAPAVGAAGALLGVAIALGGPGAALGPSAAVAALTLAGGLLVAVPARWAAQGIGDLIEGERARLEAFQDDLAGLLDQLPG